MIARATFAILFILGVAGCSTGRQADAGAGATSGATSSAVAPAPAAADSSRPADVPAQPGSLAGDWVLASIPGRTFNVPAGAKPATLSFAEAEKRASGDASCNRFSGTYRQAGDSLTFGPLASTKRACADEALNQRESAFLTALSATKRYRIEGRHLQLIGDSGPVAELDRPAGG